MRAYQSSHNGNDKVYRAVSPNHDNIAMFNACGMEMMGEDVGGLVDLAVGEDALW